MASDSDSGSPAGEIRRGLFLTVEDIERLASVAQGSLQPAIVADSGDSQAVPASWCGVVVCGGITPIPKPEPKPEEE